MDPLTIAMMAGGTALDFLKSRQAQSSANANIAAQQQYLANALAEARAGRAGAMQTAGGLREDQFGNATYYDPAQGRWVTSFSPTQQRLIDEGQARQGRAQARGRQASQDYDTERAGFLYDKPKTEAQSYSEIVQLLQDAQGTGERGLNTLMDRFGIRTAGNLPQVVQMDRGPSPAQQLAETMLKARSSALDESLKRKAGHSAEYLPAMKQFEDTANYVAPEDPTGKGIISMAQQGIQDLLKTGLGYDQILGNINIGGARNVGSASDSLTKAIMGDKTGSDLMSMAKSFITGNKGAGTAASGTSVGGTDSDGNSSGSSIGNWDHRLNFGPSTKGVGGEAAPFGGARPGDYSSNDPFDIGTYGVPNYNPYGGSSAADYSGGYYRTPWSF